MPTGDEIVASNRCAAFAIKWWPVGQGLFMSGCIGDLNRAATFCWVYDCGTSSPMSVLDKAIVDYRTGWPSNGSNNLDLLAISHFDNDHISGISALIKGQTVKTVMLPYFPLWQRLIIAAEQGIVTTDPVFEFFVDPVAYLMGVDGGEIREILFVPTHGPDDIASAAPEAPESPESGESIIVDYGVPPEDAMGDPAIGADSDKRVKFLRAGGRIAVSSIWEFVPYNDSHLLPKATPTFLAAAARVVRIFKKERYRAKALRLLKRLYDHHFGKSGLRRNLISLFLYSGAVGRQAKLEYYCTSGHNIKWNARKNNFAQLLTGDGYLNTATRLDALKRFYLLDQRLARAGVLQVMHHGALSNWHHGVASALAPAVSIFSSEPSRSPHHPHPSVLNDFSSWCPVQVDSANSYCLFAVITWP